MGGFDGSQTTSVSESWQTWIYESYCLLMLYRCILKLLVVDLLKILVIDLPKLLAFVFFPEMLSFTERWMNHREILALF